MFQEMPQTTSEDFFPKTESSAEEMDTSDTQWGWFYLAECGKWHMFQVNTYEVILAMMDSIHQTTYCGFVEICFFICFEG